MRGVNNLNALILMLQMYLFTIEFKKIKIK